MSTIDPEYLADAAANYSEAIAVLRQRREREKKEAQMTDNILTALSNEQRTAIRKAICPYCAANLPDAPSKDGDYTERKQLHHIIFGTPDIFPCWASPFRHAVLAADGTGEIL